jgi:hypothetical protein
LTGNRFFDTLNPPMDPNPKSGYYRPVTGSRELRTGPRKSDDTLRVIETGNEGLAPQRYYRGEWLGGVKFSGVTVPTAVFDLLAPTQTALEQAVYLHLFRLAYGEGRNFCRVGKREISGRTGLSDRRLNVVLDGLVRKGHIKPLHRDTGGTLYRVFLPSELLRLDPEPGLVRGPKIEKPEPPAPVKPVAAGADAAPLPETAPPAKGRAAARPPAAKAKAAKKAARQKPLESPLNEERFADVSGKPVRGPGLSQMADRFFAARKVAAGQTERQLALTVLTELLEDGFSRDEVMTAVEWLIVNLPEEKTLDRLPYVIATALEK